MSNVTSANLWKSSSRQGVELTVPSGNVALVRNPGMQLFIQRGMVPNSLLSVIQKSIKAGSGKDAAQTVASEIDSQDMNTVNDLISFIDSVVIYCVIKPQLTPIPAEPEAARDEALLYVDDVDMDDKMYIFQFAVGGTKDLEQFRSEQNAMLELVQSSENVAETA